MPAISAGMQIAARRRTAPSPPTTAAPTGGQQRRRGRSSPHRRRRPWCRRRRRHTPRDEGHHDHHQEGHDRVAHPELAAYPGVRRRGRSGWSTSWANGSSASSPARNRHRAATRISGVVPAPRHRPATAPAMAPRSTSTGDPHGRPPQHAAEVARRPPTVPGRSAERAEANPRAGPRLLLGELAAEEHDGAQVLEGQREPDLTGQRGAPLGLLERQPADPEDGEPPRATGSEDHRQARRGGTAAG